MSDSLHQSLSNLIDDNKSMNYTLKGIDIETYLSLNNLSSYYFNNVTLAAGSTFSFIIRNNYNKNLVFQGKVKAQENYNIEFYRNSVYTDNTIINPFNRMISSNKDTTLNLFENPTISNQGELIYKEVFLTADVRKNIGIEGAHPFIVIEPNKSLLIKVKNDGTVNSQITFICDFKKII
jgi:hypothetical protein